jgi:imidazolonepropionase
MLTLIKNIKQLAGLRTGNKTWLQGAEMNSLLCIDNAYLLIEGERIESFGAMKDLDLLAAENRAATVIDATGKTVVPAWCDSHTHIVYAGSREVEFVDRIKGLSYEEIARRGGGILNSAQRLHAASEEELFDAAWMRLQEVASLGTGAIEIKSGYGLSLEGELKMLRVIRRLKEKSALTIKSNFLAAHAYPLAYKEDHEGYLNLIIEKMLPQIADEGLADYIDAFCEFGFFSVDETARVLEAGARYGLKPKIHANQLNYSGGIQVGVKYNAVSVDHLECVGEEELAALKGSKTIGTLLPSAAFFLGIAYQPARKMIDAGLGIALATDYNPGSSPSGNMPFVLSLACTQLKMTPEEAINAATINGAYAMELSEELGSIAPGMRANLIITKEIPSYAYIPYSFGSHLTGSLILNGKLQ